MDMARWAGLQRGVETAQRCVAFPDLDQTEDRINGVM